MDNLPRNGILSKEEYDTYLELYFLNKSNLNDKTNNICINCNGGHVEITEDKKTLLLNCNKSGCYHFKLNLPTYHLFDDSVEKIKYSSENNSIKEKNIKKLQDKYDLLNDTEQKKKDLEQHLDDYRDLTIDTTDPKNLAQYNFELINIEKNIINILNKPKPVFVSGNAEPSVFTR
jgi:hypothetical protein